MPVVVRKRKGKKKYKIVEKSTGRMVGSSTTRAKAQASARVRNAAIYGWKPAVKRKISAS